MARSKPGQGREKRQRGLAGSAARSGTMMTVAPWQSGDSKGLYSFDPWRESLLQSAKLGELDSVATPKSEP